MCLVRCLNAIKILATFAILLILSIPVILIVWGLSIAWLMAGLIYSDSSNSTPHEE